MVDKKNSYYGSKLRNQFLFVVTSEVFATFLTAEISKTVAEPIHLKLGSGLQVPRYIPF